MTSNAATDGGILGTLRAVDGTGTVRLEAHLPTGIEDLWSALTDPRRLVRWLGEVEGDLRPGGEFRARFFASGWEGTGRVEMCDAPRRLLVRTSSVDEPEGLFEVTLTADGDHTVVVVEDRGLPLDQLAAYGAGDQIHVEDLAAHLAGDEPCDARARWRALEPGYRERAAELARTSVS